MGEALFFYKSQRAKGRTPHLLVGIDVQTSVKADPGGFCQFDVAIEIGLAAIFFDQALVAFYTAKKAIAVSPKDHGTVMAALNAVRGNGFEDV